MGSNWGNRCISHAKTIALPLRLLPSLPITIQSCQIGGKKYFATSNFWAAQLRCQLWGLRPLRSKSCRLLLWFGPCTKSCLSWSSHWQRPAVHYRRQHYSEIIQLVVQQGAHKANGSIQIAALPDPIQAPLFWSLNIDSSFHSRLIRN